MSPLIPFIRAISFKLSDNASQHLRLLIFDLMKVVLCLRMTLYAFPMFSERFLVHFTHSNSSTTSIILIISALPVLTLTGLAMIFVASFIIVDFMYVPYVSI